MCRTLIITVWLACAAASMLPSLEGTPELGAEPCRVFCTTEYNPVCGTDGKDYGNLCMLKCAGTQLAHRGLCKDKDCFCTFILRPVCGEDGKVYSNRCIAECANVTVAYDGPCDDDTITCEKGVQTAACFVDPCLGQTCPSDPNATCISNYCPGITRFRGTYVSGPCTTVFVDADGGKPVDCCEEQLSNVT